MLNHFLKNKKYLLILSLLVIIFLYFFIGSKYHINNLPNLFKEVVDRNFKQELNNQIEGEGVEVTVTKIEDGDTMVVTKYGAVRLIGINTPEVSGPYRKEECFGKQASEFAKRELLNQRIVIKTDSSQAKYDKYDRLLVYIFKTDGFFYNQEAIMQGYAYEHTYDKPYFYQKDFRSAQNLAKTKQLGLWNKQNCP